MSQNTLCGRPLVFGDIQQIKALKILRAMAEKEEERKRMRAAGERKTFEVEVSVLVEAADKDEAEDIVISGLDMTVSAITATEVD